MASSAITHLASGTFGSSARVTVNNFGTDYDHLIILFKDNGTGTVVRPKLEINGSSSLRKRSVEFGSHGINASGNAINGNIYTSYVEPGQYGPTEFIVEVYDYNNVNAENVIRVTASKEAEAVEWCFDYLTTGAITSVAFKAEIANWPGGTVSVYGVKGS